VLFKERKATLLGADAYVSWGQTFFPSTAADIAGRESSLGAAVRDNAGKESSLGAAVQDIAGKESSLGAAVQDIAGMGKKRMMVGACGT